MHLEIYVGPRYRKEFDSKTAKGQIPRFIVENTLCALVSELTINPSQGRADIICFVKDGCAKNVVKRINKNEGYCAKII